MRIRNVKEEEFERIFPIIEAAKQFMRKNGNPTQWGPEYPDRAMMLDRIRRKQLYFLEEDGVPHALFAFILGEDPTYRIIEDGSWLSDAPYGTIHTLASDGTLPHVFDAVLGYCLQMTSHIRIDTHADNRVMQHLAEKYGFSKRGIIYVGDGTPRIAYERL